MWQRRMLILFFFALILSQSDAIQAFQNPDTERIYIFVNDNSDDMDYSSVIPDSVRQYLASSGIELVFYTLPNEDFKTSESPIIDLYYAARISAPTMILNLKRIQNSPNGSTFNISVGVQTVSRHLPVEDVSPVLVGTDDDGFGGYGPSINFPFEDADGEQFISDSVTGMALYLNNRCEDAISFFQRAADDFSQIQYEYKDRRALNSIDFYLGTCLVLTNKMPEAAQKYESLLSWFTIMRDLKELQGWSVPAAINLSWLYFNMGRKEEAFDLMDAAVQSIQSGVGNCHIDIFCFNPIQWVLPHRAQLYALAERYEDAIADLNEAINLPSTETPEIYLQRGNLYALVKDWDKALADYNQALELRPTYADAYYERGVLYNSISKTVPELLVAAQNDFHRYLELAPDGDHAADAARYTAQIEKELEALNG